MSNPFMQLYVADYLGDTRHLTTEQHGAYLLLLMAMWRANGKLPAEDAKLARIVGLTAAKWKRISEDVMAFFQTEDGQITQARLAAELSKANEKSLKRSQSGKLGGEAKALKNKEQGLANASDLPKHSSEPEPEYNPPTPLRLEPFAKLVGLSASGTLSEVAEAIYLAQPVTGGKRKAARPDVRKGLTAALKRGGNPAEIVAALTAYYALPDCRRDSGRYARGAEVMLNNDRWRDFVPKPQGQPPPTDTDPAFRAHCERHYAMTGEWRPEWGEKPRRAA